MNGPLSQTHLKSLCVRLYTYGSQMFRAPKYAPDTASLNFGFRKKPRGAINPWSQFLTWMCAFIMQAIYLLFPKIAKKRSRFSEFFLEIFKKEQKSRNIFHSQSLIWRRRDTAATTRLYTLEFRIIVYIPYTFIP